MSVVDDEVVARPTSVEIPGTKGRGGFGRKGPGRVDAPKADPLEDRYAARNWVEKTRVRTPFVTRCVTRLAADPFWLPSTDQARLLNGLAIHEAAGRIG